MNTTRALIAIARVETLRLLRSPSSLTLLLVVPMLQLILFGSAIRPEGAVLPVVLAGPDPSGLVATALRREPGLNLVDAAPAGQASAAVRAGQAALGIDLPHGRGPVRATIDGTEPGLTSGADAQVRAVYGRVLADRFGVADLGPGLVIERIYNPDGRAAWGFLPALIGVVMMIAMTMLGTLSLAREREIGTWEALVALPVSPTALLAGKVAPYVVIGTLQGVAVLTLAILLFDLPHIGSIAALIALMPLFAAAHLVLGHALAARARSQLSALQGAIAFYLPSMLLSGFLYPVATLPGWARAIGSLFPLTHFIRAARSATLQGGDAADVLRHGVPIALFLAAAFLLARAVQRLRID